MVRLSLSLAYLSVAATGTLPIRNIKNAAYIEEALVSGLSRRGEFGPISTGSTAGIAGGEVVCDAEPVGSFFAGLKPPVRNLARGYRSGKSNHCLVSNKFMVGTLCCTTGQSDRGWTVPV